MLANQSQMNTSQPISTFTIQATITYSKAVGKVMSDSMLTTLKGYWWRGWVAQQVLQSEAFLTYKMVMQV